jgi:sialate O-acetylesterase
VSLDSKLLIICLLLLFSWELSNTPADFVAITLPSLFADHMVLQRDHVNSIWGKATPRQLVEVMLADKKLTTTVNGDGSWSVGIPPLPPGGPYELTISGFRTITLHDVLIGDVWLCAGQSNMGMVLLKARNSLNDIAQADYPKLRCFNMVATNSSKPQLNVKGNWIIASARTVPGFSAVGFYFAREVQKQIKVPIGLLQCAVASTSIRGWSSKGSLHEPVRKFIFCKSSSLFNGMIAPITNYGIKGIIWYQGESDIFEHSFNSYAKLLTNLINDWRDRWHEGNLPFLCVQLPNFDQCYKVPTDSPWAELREAQYNVCSSVPNTYLAVSIDTAKDDPASLHPSDKSEIGYRLAQIALASVYNKGNAFISPSYQSMKIIGNQALVCFQNTGAGIICDGSTPEGFAISGSDQVFYWADAEIQADGHEILLSSRKVQNPVAVRYAWADNPKCNVYSKDKLPLTPFRTDHWKNDTYSAKYLINN